MVVYLLAVKTTQIVGLLFAIGGECTESGDEERR